MTTRTAVVDELHRAGVAQLQVAVPVQQISMASFQIPPPEKFSFKSKEGHDGLKCYCDGNFACLFLFRF